MTRVSYWAMNAFYCTCMAVGGFVTICTAFMLIVLAAMGATAAFALAIAFVADAFFGCQ